MATFQLLWQSRSNTKLLCDQSCIFPTIKYNTKENIAQRKLLSSGKYCVQENIALRRILRPRKYCVQENIAPRKILLSGKYCAQENIVLKKKLRSGKYCAEEIKEKKIKANNFNIRSLSSLFEKGGTKHRKTKRPTLQHISKKKSKNTRLDVKTTKNTHSVNYT